MTYIAVRFRVLIAPLRLCSHTCSTHQGETEGAHMHRLRYTRVETQAHPDRFVLGELAAWRVGKESKEPVLLL